MYDDAYADMSCTHVNVIMLIIKIARQFFVKFSIVKFHENGPIGYLVVVYVQTYGWMY
jgi:hypothetical protein